jgi:hypothetical protein
MALTYDLLVLLDFEAIKWAKFCRELLAHHHVNDVLPQMISFLT